ncbi:MAG TPA: flavin reductase family protein, partial [Thermoanaerobaculia bacterium]|nr:flavin reductase family protein [Thermoanaerobaculia bacterium]
EENMELEVRRQVLRKLPYGMYVMTAAAEGRVAASTLTWLSQCSFHPPLVMIGIQAESRMHETVEKAGAIAVNILREGQEKIAETFFRPVAVEGSRLGGLAFEPGPLTGAPLLTDLPAWFEARVTDAVARGDHTVFVAEVVSAGLREEAARPLLLANTSWNYGG